MVALLLVSIIFAFTNVVWRPFIYFIVAYSLAIFGYVNGYVTARYLKFFGATDVMFSMTISAVALPLFLMVCLAVEKIFNRVDHIPNRFANKVYVAHAIILYIMNVGLCYLGAHRGYL